MDLGKDIDKIRNNFYGLDFFKHFNAAGTGATLKPVHRASEEWWRYRTTYSHVRSPINAKAESAELIGASEDEICLIHRVCEGLNIIKDIMNWSLGWNKGDNIVLTNLSYPSSVHTFLNLRGKGVEIRQIEHVDGRIPLSEWERAIDENTKLVVVNHTEWTVGFNHDVEAICKIAHDKGAYVVDDAFQTLGAMKLDVKRLNLDFMVTGSFKWTCGTNGAGIFYIRSDLIDKFEPMNSLYNNIVKPGDSLTADYRLMVKPDHDNLETYDNPYVNTAQKFARSYVYLPTSITNWEFGASLKYFNYLGRKYGWDNVTKRIRGLGSYLIEGLSDIGCKVNTPAEPGERHGLITYTTGSHQLNERSYNALVKHTPSFVLVLRYTAGVGGLRVCTHFYNTEEEIDELLSVQKSLIK
jgi:selenocysteine lyase/cysteine desulfurase